MAATGSNSLMSGRQILNQRALPGASRLQGDYLYDFDRLARFYPAGAPRLERLAALAGKRIESEAARRATAAVLARQNAGRGAATDASLRRFATPGAVAVVAGQQAGLLGGPLLVAAKALTAVRLAEDLRRQGVEAVPVFWVASQDHDLAEVNHAWVLDATPQPVRISTPLGPAGGSVGPLRLGPEIEATLAEFERCCQAPAPDLRAAYHPGATLAGAFADLLARWFASWGLLNFDPMDAAELAPVWSPLHSAVLDRQSELAAGLGARNQELVQAGYHAQVEQTAAASMLFLQRDAVRQGIRRRPEGGWLLGEEPVAEDDLRSWIRQHPEQVSPSALLRPVLQDTAFPTVAQVTGPAETAYLAQSAVLFEALGVAQPIAWPRASLTLVDAKAQRLLEKYQLPLEAIFHEPAQTLLARRALPAGIERAAAGLRENFERGYQALASELQRLDPTLEAAGQGAAQKIQHQLEQLEAKVTRSFGRRSEELSAQARHLDATLYPNRHMQERVLATAAWVARDPGLLARLHEAVDPAEPGHQIIAL